MMFFAGPGLAVACRAGHRRPVQLRAGGCFLRVGRRWRTRRGSGRLGLGGRQRSPPGSLLRLDAGHDRYARLIAEWDAARWAADGPAGRAKDRSRQGTTDRARQRATDDAARRTGWGARAIRAATGAAGAKG